MAADICTVVLAMVLGQVVAPPTAQPEVPPEPSWTISGRITDRDTGQPLPRARVSIHTGVLDLRKPAVRSTVTDVQGVYEIPDVRPGAYTVLAQPPLHVFTHLPQQRGNDRPYDPYGGIYLTSDMAILVKGSDVRDVNIALARALTIEGRVVNEHGDAMAGVSVSSIRTDQDADESAARLTDDRGQFRIFGLLPGRYRVCASAPVSPAPGAATSVRGTCHPQRGEWIDLTAASATGLELKLSGARSASVSGTAVDAAGTPLARGDIQLVDEQGASRRLIPIERMPGGRFVARNVEPGDYKIVAVLNPESPLDTRERELASVPITVGSSDLDNLLVQTRRPARVAGFVTFEGGVPEGGPGSIQISGQPRDPLAVLGIAAVPRSAIKTDFTFELGGLLEPARIAIIGQPWGWVVKSVFYRGREVADAFVEFESSTDPRALEIVLTNRAAYVTGRVVAPETKTLIVVLISADRSRWTTRAALTFTGVKDGRFQVGPVRAGDYFIVAVPITALQTIMSPNPAVAIEALATRASHIVLVEGETRALTLAVSEVR